ncbi:uncharacterized protein TNCV_1410341 [Trichonephila clavipes]|nr:uncharacterized protein TNCV_1410341 [Trichonephila clavipes]
MCFPRFTFPDTKLAFRNQERKLLKATERVAQENINAALSEIKGSNSFTKCGISIDGTWQRRGYSSLNGCVSAISVDTGKILDIEVMTQYCHICAKGNSQSSKHVCSNYKGSAGNMEVVGAYRIFERSNLRDVQYNEYYGDGDSKGYESVKNFYGINTVTKLECIGHVQKRVGGAVASIKKKRRKVWEGLIDRIQNYYGIAIRSNVGEKDYNDDHRDEITDFVQSIPGFQECDEDIETWMAIDAEDSVDFKC